MSDNGVGDTPPKIIKKNTQHLPLFQVHVPPKSVLKRINKKCATVEKQKQTKELYKLSILIENPSKKALN